MCLLTCFSSAWYLFSTIFLDKVGLQQLSVAAILVEAEKTVFFFLCNVRLIGQEGAAQMETGRSEE